MIYNFPSVNNDGAFCVSSGGSCRYSGHSVVTLIPYYMQGAGAGSDPYFSNYYRTGFYFGAYVFPLFLASLSVYILLSRQRRGR